MKEPIARLWRDAAAEARKLVDAGRQPYAPIEYVSALYVQLGDDERRIVDGLIAADLDSKDGGDRYDAMWPIREFGITSAAPALQRLATRLTASAEVGGPFELDKVERLIRDTTGPNPRK